MHICTQTNKFSELCIVFNQLLIAGHLQSFALHVRILVFTAVSLYRVVHSVCLLCFCLRKYTSNRFIYQTI